MLFTLIYVLPFYLSSKTRPSPELSRDAPSVIRARIRAVTASCIVASLVTIHVALNHAHLSYLAAAHVLGYWPLSLADIAKSLALLVVLFIGPLFEAAVCEGQWRDWLSMTHVLASLSSWTGWRNYVAVRWPHRRLVLTPSHAPVGAHHRRSRLPLPINSPAHLCQAVAKESRLPDPALLWYCACASFL